ncbi:MAG: aspartate/tyrosine/aromatic aminotransferase [Desulfofustis sp.]|nr:aspartate/tyrosine/aromatic aminotransferase [Desulfofustis sp.]MBT8354210.1 aspartate/tyrosine/aromatic aminotransferase [Desulfofustis sp.]
MWKSITAAAPDAIFGLTAAFKQDTNPNKVNLGAGVYKNDQGVTPILESVKQAERLLLDEEQTKSYLPISGDPLYTSCVQRLMFGEGSEVISSGRAVTAHAPGGTGALRIGGELIQKFNPGATMWISSPTWANHHGIFGAAGFQLKNYPYYNSDTKGLSYDEFISALAQVPAGDVVLLHGCCHNPTGVDLEPGQWAEVASLAAEKGWIGFLDFAYQGFGDSVDGDRSSVDAFASAGSDFFVASSFSKNFGLYNERTGAITVVSPSRQEATVAKSHLDITVRVCYSNPPAHGGLIVKTVLSNEELEKNWRSELEGMCSRIKTMRSALVDGLAKRGIDEDFAYIKQQRGMFSFSGLSDETVAWLKTHKSIYVVGGGRINVAGLTTGNIDYVCDSIAEGLKG